MNSFGHNFRITLFGESHGEYLGVVVDGVKPGIMLSDSDFTEDIARRHAGSVAAANVVAAMDAGAAKTMDAGIADTAAAEAMNADTSKVTKAKAVKAVDADTDAIKAEETMGREIADTGVKNAMTANIGSAGTVGVTARREDDAPKIISGVYNGITTGAPVAILFFNSDIRPADYARFAAHPRPSHADLAASVKYGGFNDPRGGGIFSGRMTLCLVAAGVIAKKMVPQAAFETLITEIGGCPDAGKFADIIEKAAAAGDSVGGVVQTTVTGFGRSYGEPFFDSVESVISHLLFSVPAVKGVEFGAGFASAMSLGSQNNDMIVDATGKTATNNDGGINGGITNGNPIVVRVAIKPAPSIAMPQQTYNFEEEQIAELRIGGRHDSCIALRAAVVIEAAVAIALADLSLVC